MKFLKSSVDAMLKKYRESIKSGKGLPKAITIKDSTGKIVNLKTTEYLGVIQQQNIFQLNNGRKPNYVTYNSKCSTLPVAMDYQNNSVNCCPTSLSMAIACLGGFKSESTCAKTLHTGSSGTSPSDLVAYAPKLGYTVKQIGRNYKSVYNSLKKGKPVIAHIQTRPATCLGFQGDYGHYVLIYWCKNNKYYVADPTKGIKKCSAGILDKATNGRDIHYFSVGIQ